MNKKILTASLLSVFISSFVVTGASAETKFRNESREIGKRLINKIATTTASSFASSVASSTVLACVKAAVVARENSIIEASNSFSASMTSAYQIRLDGLGNAWDITNAKERKTAIKTTFNSFKDSSKTARKTLQNSNKTAWTTFENATKSCRKGMKGNEVGAAEENEGRGIDISVSN